ncbi:hypothetical protein [Desulfobacter postgatei]|jgi:hypothetical protein|uniref:hypothetical protein n=1 Tax=Desulfobacter postgatei TaxID=2293 RepID=UPI002A35AB03|nr:hypothetical protein [Desulfobacter postgatei]MDX9963625.1 hypothetical protein [Desulfobacter postgatei]
MKYPIPLKNTITVDDILDGVTDKSWGYNYMFQNYFIKIFLSANLIKFTIPTINSFHGFVSPSLYRKFSIPFPWGLTTPFHSPTSPPGPFTSTTVHTLIFNFFDLFAFNGVTVDVKRISFGRFHRTFRIKAGTRQYTVTHTTGSNGYSDVVTVYYPDFFILQELEELFSVFPYYHIEEVEFPLDYHLPGREADISNQLDQITHLRYSSRGKPMLQYPGTTYYNNVRQSRTKGGKHYEKLLKDDPGLYKAEVDKGWQHGPINIIRQELTLKRQKLRPMKNKPGNIGVDKISDLSKIDINEIIQPMAYQTVDIIKYASMRIHANHSPGYSFKKAMELYLDLRNKKLKHKKVVLENKGLKPHYRFIKPHPFQRELINKLQGKSFFTGDYALIDRSIFFEKVLQSVQV